MCNWRKWIWPGILATVILTALSTWFLLDTVQNDLRTKSLAALQAEHPWADVELDGRDLTITGIAPSEEAQEAARAVTLSDNVYDVRVAADASTLPPIVDPYKFTAVRDGNKVTLTGNYPSDAVRAEIVAKAQEEVPGAEIDDQMTLARGAAPGFAALAAFGLSQLGDLEGGTADVTGSDYSITGVAATSEIYSNTLAAAGGDLPGDGNLAAATIEPPTVSPYAWNAEYTGDALTLNGVVPSEEARAAILAKANEVAPGATVTDNMTIAKTAPDGFVDAANYGLGFMPQFIAGKVNLSDSDFSVEGSAKSTGDYNTAKGATNNLPAGFNLASEEITPAEVSPYEWMAQYDGSTLTLSGAVPDVATRQALLDKAAADLPNATVVDEMFVARTAPSGFQGAASYGIAQMPEFVSGVVSISDTNYTVEGVARDADAYTGANQKADNLPDGFALASKQITPPTISPYAWSADYDGSKIVLNGAIPNEEARSEITAAASAAVPDAEIEDRMFVANTAPGGFVDTAKYGLGFMPKFISGRTAISDTNFEVEGISKSGADYTNAIADTQNLPAGFNLAKEEIQPRGVSPYTWNADYDGDKVVLTGFVPNEDERARIIRQAGEALPGKEVVDQMEIAAGVPATYGASTAYALDTMKDFVSGQANLSDNDLGIRGVAGTVDGYDRARGLLDDSVPANVALVRDDVTPPTVSPYELVATKSDGVITVTGYAPSNGVRQAIVGAARKANPDSRIVDRIRIANAVPTDVRWAEAGRYGFEILNDVSEGSFAIRDTAFSVEGLANDVEAFDRSKGKVAAGVPNGLTLATENIRLPQVSPYVWEVTRTDNAAKITGFVPERAVGDGNLEVAQSFFGNGVTVTDEQRVAGGVPRNFSTATSLATQFVNRLDNATATLTDTNLFVKGEALTGVAANEIRAQIERSLPPGYVGTHDITVRPIVAKDFVAPDVCQTLLDTYLTVNQILFETDKAIIRPNSFGLLDRLSAVTQRCPNSRIEISGHTDSDGSEAYNQDLSERRAGAVRDYLVRSGIFTSRLDVKGFGESQPVASNATEEGKQKNRRIEFRVIR